MKIKLAGLPGLFFIGVLAGIFVVGIVAPDDIWTRVAIALAGGLAACLVLPALGWLILKIRGGGPHVHDGTDHSD
jgi:hypothetical protein